MPSRLLCVSVIGLCLLVSVAAAQDKIVLQQGISPSKDYLGCQTATLWPAGSDQKPDQGNKVLYFRGEKNRLLVKFDIPSDLRGKTLARARLWVYLPKADKMFRYCEITCNGMVSEWDASADWTQATENRRWRFPGGDFDNVTEYHNGRFLGATDSYELYAPNHDYWFNHMADLPVGVSEGGLWVSLNVTPLAEKWLAHPELNLGVMLMGVRDEDKRFPNEWQIDIPSAAYTQDVKLRPKLELEFAPVAQAVQVGLVDTLAKYNPWSSRFDYKGQYKNEYDLYLAGNEFEGFQAIVYPMLADLKNVRFTWDEPTDAKSGAKLTQADIVWQCEDMLKLGESWTVRDRYFGGKKYWVPDPLVPSDLAPENWRKVRRQQATPFWFTVHAPAGTKAGDYVTTLTMTADGMEPVKLKLNVHVWDYEIPAQWNFATVGQFIYDNVVKFYGKNWQSEWMEAWYSFLLDHRFVPTEEYKKIISPRPEMLAECVRRGINAIYINGDFSTKVPLDLLGKQYAEVKDKGYIDNGMIYVEDEGQQQEMRRTLARRVRLTAPEAMMMVGGAFPHPDVIGYVDVWDPEIDVWPGAKMSLAEARKVIQECKDRGERFFWYVAAAPEAPYPNVQLENPPIAGRAFLWMSWKYGSEGLEYYCYNIWDKNMPEGKRWPQVAWNAQAFKTYNSDGNLFYPGPDGHPCSSIRLENLRDGIEDWESLYVLRDYADALKAASGGSPTGKAADLIAQAQALLDVPDDVVKDVTNWTQDGQRLLATRRAVGDLIVAIKAEVTSEQYEKVRDARLADRLDRQHKMLAQRVQDAQAWAATQPSSQTQPASQPAGEPTSGPAAEPTTVPASQPASQPAFQTTWEKAEQEAAKATAAMAASQAATQPSSEPAIGPAAGPGE